MGINIGENEVRDRRYALIYDLIQERLAALKEKVDPTFSSWGSLAGFMLERAALRNGYRRSFTKDKVSAAQFFVIGYETGSLDSIAALITTLGEFGMLKECTVLSEGYDGEARMISRRNPPTNSKLNQALNQYGIKLSGRDSCELRERQYDSLVDLLGLPPFTKAHRKKMVEAMDCLVKREKYYFLPAIEEKVTPKKPTLFLTNLVHAVSSNFQLSLSNNGIDYAFFVPRY